MNFNLDPLKINPLVLLAVGVVAGVAVLLLTGPIKEIVFLLAVFGFVGAIVLWRLRSASAGESAIVAGGKSAVATVIAFAPTGDTMGRTSRMRVDYEVVPDDGSDPFVFRATKFFRNDALPQLDEHFEAHFTTPKTCVIGGYVSAPYATAPSPGQAGGVDDLARLAQLHADGVLDDAEFAEAKRRLLDRL